MLSTEHRLVSHQKDHRVVDDRWFIVHSSVVDTVVTYSLSILSLDILHWLLQRTRSCRVFGPFASRCRKTIQRTVRHAALCQISVVGWMFTLWCYQTAMQFPLFWPIFCLMYAESLCDRFSVCVLLIGASLFLRKVDDILNTELKHMPGRYSLTALLNTWVGISRLASSNISISGSVFGHPSIYTFFHLYVRCPSFWSLRLRD